MDDQSASEISWCSSVHIVAEVIFFLFKTGEALLEPTARLYISSGVCIQEFYNETWICDQLSNFPNKENHVQAIAASYLAYYKLVVNLPALFLAVFCGAWSDRVGRKLPIIMSSFGTIVAVAFYLGSLFTINYSSWAFIILLFVGAAVRGAFGKSTVTTMAVHSYVADVSSKKSRTQKLSKLLSMNYFGYFFGSLLTGALLQWTDFAYVFTAVIVVNSIVVFVTIYLLRESVPLNISPEMVEVHTKGKRQDWKSRMPFRWQNVRDSVAVVTKSRQHHGRLHILFFFMLIFIQQACKSGEVDITVLYTSKYPLSWEESTYGYLLAVDYACLGIASAIILPLLVRYFHAGDLTLCLIGILFKILRLAMFAYGTYTWLVFLSVVIGCPSALIISSAKSLVSKSVSDDEMGKTFSLLSCGETIANLVGSLVFTGLYAATVRFHPGLTFAIDSGLMVLLLIAVLVLIVDVRRTKTLPDINTSYSALEANAELRTTDTQQLTDKDKHNVYGSMNNTTTHDGGHDNEALDSDTCNDDGKNPDDDVATKSHEHSS